MSVRGACSGQAAGCRAQTHLLLPYHSIPAWLQWKVGGGEERVQFSLQETMVTQMFRQIKSCFTELWPSPLGGQRYSGEKRKTCRWMLRSKADVPVEWLPALLGSRSHTGLTFNWDAFPQFSVSHWLWQVRSTVLASHNSNVKIM